MQKNADESKHNTVVLLLQDMLEVVTRDMMVNEIRLVILTILLNMEYLFSCFDLTENNKELFDSFSELAELGQDSGRQLFEKVTDSEHAIAFPPPVTSQWEEQVILISIQLL